MVSVSVAPRTWMTKVMTGMAPGAGGLGASGGWLGEGGGARMHEPSSRLAVAL